MKEVHKQGALDNTPSVEHFENRQWVDLNPFSLYLLFIPSNLLALKDNCNI